MKADEDWIIWKLYGNNGKITSIKKPQTIVSLSIMIVLQLKLEALYFMVTNLLISH